MSRYRVKPSSASGVRDALRLFSSRSANHRRPPEPNIKASHSAILASDRQANLIYAEMTVTNIT